jgi:hypothetical protein
MIEVVNLRDTPNCTRVDRTTKWGNPYALTAETSRSEVVDQYMTWAIGRFDDDELLELDDQRIGCWCAPLLCHGNALQALVANAKGTQRHWALVSGEAPRRQKPLPPTVNANYQLMVRAAIAQLPSNAVVVHGGAQGVDSIAHYEAKQRRLDVVRWPADMLRRAKRAGVDCELHSTLKPAGWEGPVVPATDS